MTDQIRLTAERLLFDIRDLASNSTGVAGLHRNGDIAPWPDLLEDGTDSPWLGDGMAEADAALTAQPAPPAEGEVAELIRLLRLDAQFESSGGMPKAAARLTRAAELLAQRYPEPLPDNNRGVLPMIVSETGAVDEPETERIVCAWISGGADYVNNMPRRLGLERITPEESIFADYVQVSRDAPALPLPTTETTHD